MEWLQQQTEENNLIQENLPLAVPDKGNPRRQSHSLNVYRESIDRPSSKCQWCSLYRLMSTEFVSCDCCEEYEGGYREQSMRGGMRNWEIQ